MVALKAVPIAVKIQEIESASAEDKELQAVRNCLVSGNWEKCPRPFVMVRNELTFIGQVILRGTRIVIPKVLRQRVVELAHEGHQGIVKMKERLRSKVWWPGIDKDAGQKCRECYGCQLVTKETITPPVENNQDARKAMAGCSTGLTWAHANGRIFAGPSGLLQPMGGS